jgi:hypothetical protein
VRNFAIFGSTVWRISCAGGVGRRFLRFRQVFGDGREQRGLRDRLEDAVENDNHGAQREHGRAFDENGLEFADGGISEVCDLRAVVSGLL